MIGKCYRRISPAFISTVRCSLALLVWETHKDLWIISKRKYLLLSPALTYVHEKTFSKTLSGLSQGFKGLFQHWDKSWTWRCLGKTADLQQNLIQSFTQWKHNIVDFQHFHDCFLFLWKFSPTDWLLVFIPWLPLHRWKLSNQMYLLLYSNPRSFKAAF